MLDSGFFFGIATSVSENRLRGRLVDILRQTFKIDQKTRNQIPHLLIPEFNLDNEVIFSSWYKHSIFCNSSCLCFRAIMQKRLVESHSGTLLSQVFKLSSLDVAIMKCINKKPASLSHSTPGAKPVILPVISSVTGCPILIV